MSIVKHTYNLDWSKYLVYDENSPSCLTWIKHSKYMSDTLIFAGWKSNLGYYVVELNGIAYVAHRIVYKLHYPETDIQNYLIDHIDGNVTNNKIDNLRVVSSSQNMRNMKLKANNKSGICNVYRSFQANKYNYYVVKWHENGKRKQKRFSIDKYGEECAFTMAKQFRINVYEQNRVQEGFTERHGT